MFKSLKKIFSVILTLLIIFTCVSSLITVNASEIGKVRVIVCNDTYHMADGALWEGTLIDEYVDLTPESNAISAFIEAITNNGYTQKGAENGIIDEINGISTGDNGYMSGWMGTINDWFTNQGLSSYTVQNKGLQNGDEIRILYTSDWGADLGSYWTNNYTTLNSIETEGATIYPVFDKDITEYTLNINKPVSKIKITPTATNKNFQVKTYLNKYTPEIENSEYKRSSYIDVSDGDKIYIGVGDPIWPSMGYSEKPEIYTLTVKNINNDYFEKISEISDNFLKLNIPNVSSVGGDWLITALSQNGSISDEFVEGYYDNTIEYIKNKASSKLDRSKSSENSRVIIALSSINKDVTDVGGYNLLEPLADFDFVKKQGLNGPVWTLIALDCKNYSIPNNDDFTNQTTREKLIDYIIEKQLPQGGWDNKNTSIDPDSTAMAIQALAPYYNKNNDVKSAIDLALTKLSEIQKDDGSFTSYDSKSSESCSQVINALISLNINPQKDTRFIKNNNTVLDSLMTFSVDNGFAHYGSTYDQMASEQGFLALVSFKRFLNNQSFVYDMNNSNSKYPLGDVNLDGEVNIMDATEIQKNIVEIVQLNEQQKALADFNKDGVVSILDTTSIQYFIVMK